jgi:hypothetical protein
VFPSLPPTFGCACVEWTQVAAPISGPAPIEKVISEEEQQRRTQARREQGLRLKAMAENRRKEKVGSSPLTHVVCAELARNSHQLACACAVVRVRIVLAHV